jgi:serine/tyrosine/threonine adenylyltransferase
MALLTKYPISALPLPPPSKILIHNLTPDPATPSVSAFKYTLRNSPSTQRRARLTAPQSHFSHVSPLPLSFPYEIEPPDNPGEAFDHDDYVEEWLAAREALNPREAAEKTESDTSERLRQLYPASRHNDMELLGLSDTGLRDCLPHLDVGDAFELLGKPSLLGHADSQEKQVEDEKAAATRHELIDVLGGHAMLITGDDADVSFAPWSLRYSGHQFGHWAGQLGDGRAISIRMFFFSSFRALRTHSETMVSDVTPHPSYPETTYELQLKGAGRTPFSRRADGLAVIRSSVREYLCAEGG